MFEFSYLEEWWMDVVITAAIISGAAGVICVIAGAVITKKGQLTKLGGMIEKTDVGLSKDHEDLKSRLSEVRDRISDRIAGLSSDIRDTKNLTDDIWCRLIEDRKDAEFRYENLSDKQKTMADSLTALDGMMDEMKALAEENRNLKEEVKDLKKEIIQLKQMRFKSRSRNDGMER